MLSGLIIGQMLISSATKTRSTSELPDLAISQQNITISSSTPIAGEEITINATIWNVGTADATNVEVNFYEEDILIGSENVDLPVYGTWKNQALDSYGDVGFTSSIAIDNGNGVHISYQDSTNFDLKYAYMPYGGDWSIVTVDAADDISGGSLAIDSKNGVHIGYYDSTNRDLKYAFKPMGGGWSIFTVDSSGDVGKGASIAVDGADGIHISYRDLANKDLKYIYKPSGGSWTNYSIDSIGDIGLGTSIIVDSVNGIHISYCHHNGLYYDLKYAYKPNGGSWTNYTIDPTSNVEDPSIAVDSKNGIHISYYNDINKDLKYAYKPNGGNWINSTIETGVDVGHFPSIAVDGLDGVHISYRNVTYRDLNYLYKANGKNWTTYEVDTQGDVGFRSSIAVDSNYGIHISYHDLTNSDLKYANRIVPSGNVGVSLSWTPTVAGLRNITVKLDENNLVQELDETNNEAIIGITVKPGPLENIKISPSSVNLELNNTQQFNATGYDAYDNKVSITPIWEVSGGGTINQSGFFTTKYPGEWIIYANQLKISGTTNITVQVNNTADTDSDDMLDWWEVDYDLDPFNPSDAALDLDLDSLSNLNEFLNSTDPHNKDSDGDNLGDGFELTFSNTDPTNWDTNGNSIGDGLEFIQSQGYMGGMHSLPNDWIGMTITWDNYTIFIKTNSSVLEGEFDKTDKKLTIKVSGAKGTTGVTEIDVPKSLCKPENITVKFDGGLINYSLTQNATHYHIHIEYNHSVHELLTNFNYKGKKPDDPIVDDPIDPIVDEPVNGTEAEELSYYIYILALIIIIVIIIIIMIIVIKTRNNKVTNDVPDLPPQQLSRMLDEKHAKGEMTDETYNDIRSKLKKYQDQ